MTLISVLVALGLSTLMALGTAQVMSHMSQSQSQFRAKNEIEYFHMELRDRLDDRQACINTFNPLGKYTDNTQHLVEQIMNNEPSNPTVRYETGKIYGSGNFKIANMAVTYKEGAAPGSGEGILEIEYEPLSVGGGGPDKLRKRTLNLKMNVDTGSQYLTSCVVVGGENGESLWKVSPSDDEKIYYIGKSVGVNTDNPRGLFDVDGGKAALNQPGEHVFISAQDAGGGSHTPGGHIFLKPGERVGNRPNGSLAVNVQEHHIKASIQMFSTQEIMQDWGANTLNGGGLLVGARNQGGDAPYLGMTTASGCRNSNSSVGWCANMLGVNMFYNPDTDTMERAGSDYSGGHNVAMGIVMTSDGNQIGGTRMGFWTGPSNSHPFERMSLTANGKLGIGNTSPVHEIHVNGTAGLSTGTAWINTSDKRLKDIHGNYEYGLKEILQLRTVRFSYKKENELGLPSDLIRTGFIAQDVQKIIPEAITHREDGYLELNVDPIHWASLNAIQELYQICTKQEDNLNERVQSLESENAALKSELQQLKEDLQLIKESLGIN